MPQHMKLKEVIVRITPNAIDVEDLKGYGQGIEYKSIEK